MLGTQKSDTLSVCLYVWPTVGSMDRTLPDYQRYGFAVRGVASAARPMRSRSRPAARPRMYWRVNNFVLGTSYMNGICAGHALSYLTQCTYSLVLESQVPHKTVTFIFVLVTVNHKLKVLWGS